MYFKKLHINLSCYLFLVAGIILGTFSFFNYSAHFKIHYINTYYIIYLTFLLKQYSILSFFGAAIYYFTSPFLYSKLLSISHTTICLLSFILICIFSAFDLYHLVVPLVILSLICQVIYPINLILGIINSKRH